MRNFTISLPNGLCFDDKQICNAVSEVVGVYFAPGAEEPAMIEVSVSIGDLAPRHIVIPPENLDFQHLHKLLPHLRCANNEKKNLFNELLKYSYIDILTIIEKGKLR